MHINMIQSYKILNGSGSKAPAYIQSEPITNTLEANLCVFLQTTGFLMSSPFECLLTRLASFVACNYLVQETMFQVQN